MDHFKEYKDYHGHPAGDRLLRSLADALMEQARTFESVGLYGGEELAVILPACPAGDVPGRC